MQTAIILTQNNQMSVIVAHLHKHDRFKESKTLLEVILVKPDPTPAQVKVSLFS